MAKNMLPIVALGAAAFFLLKKKDEPSTDAKKDDEKANGNGDTKKDEPKKDEPKANGNGGTTPTPTGPVTYTYLGACNPTTMGDIGDDVCVQLGTAWSRLRPSGEGGPLKSGDQYDQLGNCDPDNPNWPSDAMCVEIMGKPRILRKKAPEEELPANLSLQPVGDFQWGTRLRMGDDVFENQTEEVIEIAAKYAGEYGSLPFVVTHMPGAFGVQIHIMANGQPYSKWVQAEGGDFLDIDELDAELEAMLAEHIPTP